MPAPLISSFSPASIPAGNSTFTLTVNVGAPGGSLASDVVINWNGTPLTTTFVGASQATASVPSSLVLNPGGAAITLLTGGVLSGADVFPITSALDLTTIAQVKTWLSGTGSATAQALDDGNIQLCITAAGAEWLWRTGNANSDGTFPATSPFVEPVAYNEWYDGNGSDRLFLRHAPARSVQLLQINGVSIPPSSGYGSAGYAIHADGRSLILRTGGNGATLTTSTFIGSGGWRFAKGLQNINLQHTAGFDATPPDVQLASTQMVAVNYRRRSWIDQSSQAMANGAGTVRYRDWELPPEVLRVMIGYTRTAVV